MRQGSIGISGYRGSPSRQRCHYRKVAGTVCGFLWGPSLAEGTGVGTACVSDCGGGGLPDWSTILPWPNRECDEAAVGQRDVHGAVGPSLSHLAGTLHFPPCPARPLATNGRELGPQDALLSSTLACRTRPGGGRCQRLPGPAPAGRLSADDRGLPGCRDSQGGRGARVTGCPACSRLSPVPPTSGPPLQ